MKSLKFIYSILIALLINISCRDKDPCRDFVNKRYEYPVYVCTGADTTDCYSKKLKAMLLPGDFLRCSSTDTLALTCMKYPYLSNIWLYIPMQEGFDYMRKSFNGFDGLFTRKDVCKVMIDYYSRTNIQGVDTMADPVEIGRYMSKILYWEITLAQYEFINSLTAEETKSILSIVLTKYNEKSNITSYGLVGIGSTLSIAARILYKQGYDPFLQKISLNPSISHFIDNADFSTISDPNSIIQIIIDESQNYLKTLSK